MTADDWAELETVEEWWTAGMSLELVNLSMIEHLEAIDSEVRDKARCLVKDIIGKSVF